MWEWCPKLQAWNQIGFWLKNLPEGGICILAGKYLWYTHLCCLFLITHSWVSSELPPWAHPSRLTLRITTAADQAQGALLAKFLSKSPAQSWTWGNPSTNCAGLSKDCLLENDVRPGQSGGQWLAGAGHEAEPGSKQSFSDMCFQSNKNFPFSYHSWEGAWCVCGCLVSPSFPLTTVISLGCDC